MEHAGNEQPSFHDEGQLHNPGQATVPASLLPSVLSRLGLGDRPALSLSQADELVAALKHEASAVRVAAVRALEQGGTSSIEPLVTALLDSAWEVRAAAVWALGKLGEQAPLAALLGALADEDPSVRAAALRALSLLGDRVPLESLVLALHDAEWQVREIAALALGERGEQAPFEPLVAALHDEHASVREAARMALEQSHPEALSTIFTNPGVVPQGQPLNEREVHSPPRMERSDYLLFLIRFFGNVFGARTYPQETGHDQEVRGVDGRSDSDRHETSARSGRAAGMQRTHRQAARVKPQRPILRIAERALVALMLVGLLVSWWVITLRLHPSSHGSAMPLLAYRNHAQGSAVWSPDGRYLSFLASPTSGGDAVQVWDRATKRLATHVLPTLVAQSQRHLAVLAPNGKYLAILELDANNIETVQVWDIITWRATITAHYPSEYLVALWSADSTRIVFPTLVSDNNGDGAEQVWNVVTGHMLGTCHFPKVGVLLPGATDTYSHMSPDGDNILDVAPGDASIVDLTTCKLSIVPANAGSAVWSPEGNRFATISLADGKMVQVWDAQTGHNLSTFHLPTPVLHIVWTPDGTRIVADAATEVNVVEVATGHIVLKVTPTLVDTQPLWALSPDGRRIASLSGGNMVQVWDAVTGAKLNAYQSQGGPVQVIVWSPNSQSIATGGRDGTVDVCNGNTITWTYGGNASAVWNIVWSPDGKFIASGDATGSMRMWQVS
jgi:WD40 repeat protein